MTELMIKCTCVLFIFFVIVKYIKNTDHLLSPSCAKGDQERLVGMLKIYTDYITFPLNI